MNRSVLMLRHSVRGDDLKVWMSGLSKREIVIPATRFCNPKPNLERTGLILPGLISKSGKVSLLRLTVNYAYH